MRLVVAVALAVTVYGCGLAHERGGDAGPIVRTDAAPIAIDSAPPTRDAGPIASCTDFWRSQPACPASPDRAIGQPCATDGETCGVHCCEPGPPIGCVDGRWSPLDLMDDCRGVRCRGPHPCFDGQCAANRVCVLVTGEVAVQPQCVMPPAPIAACSDAPAGSLMTDPMSCTTCSCAPGPSADVVITIDCACC